MLFFQLDLPHRAFNANISLDMFWISQVLFNLVDLPFKGEMLIIMTISHKWNWSSPLCFYCGYFLFIWTDVSYSQESVSSAGIIPQGCCFSYSTTTIPRWWSEELKLCQLDSLAMALKKKNRVWAAADSQGLRNWPRAAAFLNLDAAYLMTCVLLFLQCDALSFFRISCKFSLPPSVRRELN